MGDKRLASLVTMETFEAHRPRLMRLAYRLLGSVSEAEDVVQEAYLRWRTASDVVSPGPFLATVVTRLSLDVLKSAWVARRAYVGRWLPEPQVSEVLPDASATLAEELSYGFMAMLERLTPEQRAVYVLRVAFDFDYAAIAQTLGVSAESCRQRMKKARDRMTGMPRYRSDAIEAQAMAARFATAYGAGDAETLMRLLAPECHFESDGGTAVKAARRVVLGRSRVSRLLLGLGKKYALHIQPLGLWAGASPLLQVRVPGHEGACALDVHGEEVSGVYFQWNERKNAAFIAAHTGAKKGVFLETSDHKAVTPFVSFQKESSHE